MHLKNFSNYEIYPDEGKIWSYKSNRFIGSPQSNGYWQVTLYDDDGEVWKTTVHRVIWTAVHGEIPENYEVNHIDEDKSNNSIANLNLMSHLENMRYGTCQQRRAEKQSKKVAAYQNDVLVLVFSSTAQAERHGFDHGAVSKCCNGTRKSHRGYQWKYMN